MRRLPTFPRSCPRSIIGAESLNCRVRNGNGCLPLANTTAKTVRVVEPLGFDTVKVLMPQGFKPQVLHPEDYIGEEERTKLRFGFC